MNQTIHKDKRHFNVIDILIILALIAAVAFAANIIVNDMFANSTVPVEYVLRVSGVDASKTQKLREGDTLIAAAAGTSLGQILALSVQDAETIVFNYDSGRFVSAAVPGKCTVYLRVRTNCNVKNNMYQIGDTRISANTSPDILLPFLYEDAEILSVNTVPTQSTPSSDSSDNS